MIRIYKDNDVKVVTNGVYNQLFKPLGYKPVIEEPKEKVVVQEPKVIKTSSKTSKQK